MLFKSIVVALLSSLFLSDASVVPENVSIVLSWSKSIFVYFYTYIPCFSYFIRSMVLPVVAAAPWNIGLSPVRTCGGKPRRCAGHPQLEKAVSIRHAK
jgi:hypothetical protein